MRLVAVGLAFPLLLVAPIATAGEPGFIETESPDHQVFTVTSPDRSAAGAVDTIWSGKAQTMRWLKSFVLLAVLAGSLCAAAGESFTPPPGMSWITVVRTRDMDTAIAVAREFEDTARVVRDTSGAYAVALEPIAHAPSTLMLLIGNKRLPTDAVLTDGTSYVETVWRARRVPEKSVELTLGQSVTMGMNNLTVTVNRKAAAGDAWSAELIGRGSDGRAFHVKNRFDYGANREVTTRLAELDPSNANPEVILNTFTGGAHCCTNPLVLTEDTTGNWRLVDLGQWDGDGMPLLEDIDDDGAAELIFADNRFLYAFDSYVDSVQPILIRRLRNGRVEDVTMRPEFRHRIIQNAWLLDYYAHANPDLWHSNGFLAAWVAAKTRIGQGDEAWTKMMTVYERESDFGQVVCTLALPILKCPPDKQRRLPFPEGLRRFLKETSYGVPAAAMP